MKTDVPLLCKFTCLGEQLTLLCKPPLLVTLLQPRLCFVHRLDPDGSCESENIKVFDGTSSNGPLLGQVCSKNDYVPVFESSASTLTFQIVTDSARIQRTVFVFYYFFSPNTCKSSFTQPSLTSPASTGYTLSCLGSYNLQSEYILSESFLFERAVVI